MATFGKFHVKVKPYTSLSIIFFLTKTVHIIMTTTNFSKFLTLAFAASSLFLTSCGTDEPTTTTPVVKEYAKVMLFHGATDAAAVNLQVDGTTKNTDSLKYGNATAYFQAELTGKKVAVGITGAKSGAKIATDSLLMNKDIGYSYFVYQENDAVKTVNYIKSVDNLALPTAGNGRIRLVHLIPDLSVGVDVELVAVGGVATTRSDFSNARFKDITNFLDVKAGTYDMKVKITGTAQLLLTAPIQVTIADGKLYTYVARGYGNAIAPRGGAISTINNN
jgi:Domain of unknown function (DUF4397)